MILLWSWKLWAGVSLDSSRPYLDALDSKGRMDWADYQEDFLISQSAEITEVPQAEIIRRIKDQRAKTKLGVETRFGQAPHYRTDFAFESIPLPKSVISHSQLEGLQKCNLEKCAFKLHSDSEIRLLVQSKNKVSLFSQFVGERLKAYLGEKKLKGYENRLDNVPYVKKAFRLATFLKSRYPKSYGYLMGDFWANQKKPEGPKSNYIRAEGIYVTGDKAQPIYRLSENLEFEENGYLNVEVHIYTNHFFDSSIRIYEVFPWPKDPKKAVYVVTDLMEVDELKKSDLIRTLFKSPMEEAIAEFRKSEMKELR
ncbi:MAG: hypothetical protein ACKN9V_09570 [Pseudomonadota bacterium]